MNTDEIKQCIPHRDPFLWLDEVTEISDTHIVAKKLLPASLPVFQGHYPAFPVFPECCSVKHASRPGLS